MPETAKVPDDPITFAVIKNAMDAIVDFDADFQVALMNPAARNIFVRN